MKQRTTDPINNKYYIRKATGGLNGAVAGDPTVKGANVLENCVGYANGRFNESINDPELLGLLLPFRYQLVCNAENFIESAKAQGLSISPTPIEGGIMVWQKGATLKGSDGAGHVEFVEAVYADGTIRCSSSGWKGWVFRTIIRTNANGRWGQDSRYKFRGCIVNPVVKGEVVPVPPLKIDGIGGAATVSALQRYMGTECDGVISGQTKKNITTYVSSLAAVQWGTGGSQCVKAIQMWCGVTADGLWGQMTSKALQRKLGVEADGIFGPVSMKALQTFLNDHKDEHAVIVTTNSQKIAQLALEYAYPEGSKNASYSKGKPKDAYKKAFQKVFPKLSISSACNCDAFFATIVRMLGIDKDYPRGFSPNYTGQSGKFTKVNKKDIQTGDVIFIDNSKHKHVCIYVGGKIVEASHLDFWPKVTDTAESRLNEASVIYRAK